MFRKFVKDRAHNRYEAYCCEDIDERLGIIEEAIASLVAGTVPDGAITLQKLADDSRTWRRELNKGRLIAEWIGTKEEYNNHIAQNGGKPQANVRYTIIDEPYPAPKCEYQSGINAKLPSAGYYIINYYFSETDRWRYSTGLFFWDGLTDLTIQTIHDRDGNHEFNMIIRADGSIVKIRNNSDTGYESVDFVAVMKIG